MIILGIDPGLATTGFGLIEVKQNKLFLIEAGCVRTSAGKDYPERLIKIYQALKKIIKKHRPEKIAVEEIFFAKNVKTAMKISEVRGIILLLARQLGIPSYQYTPLQIKQALSGYGRAEKIQIQKMVKTILNLREIPKPDDVADALAVAITCAQTIHFDKL